MNLKDGNNQQKIVGATFLVFEGDIVKDENGRITNKLREVITHDTPKSELIAAGIDTNALQIMTHDEVIRKVIEGEIENGNGN
jgi:hypothetical protein